MCFFLLEYYRYIYNIFYNSKNYYIYIGFFFFFFEKKNFNLKSKNKHKKQKITNTIEINKTTKKHFIFFFLFLLFSLNQICVSFNFRNEIEISFCCSNLYSAKWEQMCKKIKINKYIYYE